MIALNASDLHLRSGIAPRIRQHGVILTHHSAPLDFETVSAFLQEIMPPFYRDEFQNTFDTDFAYSLDNEFRFRVNVFKDLKGVGAVFRMVPNDLPTFEAILLEQSARELSELSKGLILVTGPTGSGKSTTLAAMIQHINRTRPYHIITIEDPIEFVYPAKRSLIHQRELHIHTRSYQAALRTALRQDPDVILVGEMRDIETTRLAIEAAETGHLVFATLHTNTAYSTISRIINQFQEDEQALIRVMLAENLKGVICQSLLKREDNEEGRIAAREIWLHNVAGGNLIRENKIHQVPSLIEGSQEIGMLSLNASLTRLVSRGIISPHTAWFHSMDQKDLETRLARIGFEVEEDRMP
jgi:twitching motility protein PilT